MAGDTGILPVETFVPNCVWKSIIKSVILYLEGRGRETIGFAAFRMTFHSFNRDLA